MTKPKPKSKAKPKTKSTAKPKSAAAKSKAKTAAQAEAAVIDPKLLTALICPKTHSALELSRDRSELISKKAKLAYPIREGVPIMLVEEARSLKA